MNDEEVEVNDQDSETVTEAERVEAAAALVARENHEAPTEEEVDELYTGEATPGWRQAFEGLDTRGYDLAALDVDDQAEDASADG